jgi:pimeloyl-ACP methyl ester carboxylesterase
MVSRSSRPVSESGWLPPDEWYPAKDAVARASYLSLADERVRIVTAGPEDGVPVLLLHGWGASAYSFRRMLPLLADAGYRGIAPDLRGHGLSAKPADAKWYTSAAMVAHVCDIMDALGMQSAALVGQSMGAAIAMDVAAGEPSRVRAAVLSGPVGFTPLRRINLARALRAESWLPSQLPRWGIRLLLRRQYGLLGHFTERDVDEYWAPSQFADSSRALFALVNQFDWSPRPDEHLRRLGDRVRVLVGDRDKLIGAAWPRQSVRVLPPEHVVFVPGGGHLLAEEAPERIVEAIAGLLSR